MHVMCLLGSIIVDTLLNHTLYHDMCIYKLYSGHNIYEIDFTFFPSNYH